VGTPVTWMLLCARLLWSGPDICTPDRQQLPCACAECLLWDEEPTATRYEVTRERLSDGTHMLVGEVEVRASEDGVAFHRAVWCPARDAEMPVTGEVYRYRVRPCNEAVCSLGWSNSVDYAPAVYCEWQEGAMVGVCAWGEAR